MSARGRDADEGRKSDRFSLQMLYGKFHRAVAHGKPDKCPKHLAAIQLVRAASAAQVSLMEIVTTSHGTGAEVEEIKRFADAYVDAKPKQ